MWCELRSQVCTNLFIYHCVQGELLMLPALGDKRTQASKSYPQLCGLAITCLSRRLPLNPPLIDSAISISLSWQLTAADSEIRGCGTGRRYLLANIPEVATQKRKVAVGRGA